MSEENPLYVIKLVTKEVMLGHMHYAPEVECFLIKGSVIIDVANDQISSQMLLPGTEQDVLPVAPTHILTFAEADAFMHKFYGSSRVRMLKQRRRLLESMGSELDAEALKELEYTIMEVINNYGTLEEEDSENDGARQHIKGNETVH